MKKSSIVVGLIAALAISGTAHARGGYGAGNWGGGYGQGNWGGGNGGNYGCWAYAEEVSPEQTAAYKKHLAEMLPIKDEMHNKRMEIQREWVKEKPDNEKIARLENELRDIRVKHFKAREDAGFRNGRGCYNMQRGYGKPGPAYGKKGAQGTRMRAIR